MDSHSCSIGGFFVCSFVLLNVLLFWLDNHLSVLFLIRQTSVWTNSIGRTYVWAALVQTDISFGWIWLDCHCFLPMFDWPDICIWFLIKHLSALPQLKPIGFEWASMYQTCFRLVLIGRPCAWPAFDWQAICLGSFQLASRLLGLFFSGQEFACESFRLNNHLPELYLSRRPGASPSFASV